MLSGAAPVPTPPSAASSQVAARRRAGAGGQRRALIVFLLAIVTPTLALLLLGFQSFQRQRDAVAGLTRAAQQLRAEQLAVRLETRVAALARAVLLHRDTTRAVARVDWNAPEQLHVARRALDRVCARHPPCADLVVVGPEELGLPRLDEPLPREADSLVADSGAAGLRAYSLASLARAQAVRDPGAALATWTRVAREHPDAYDLAHRPYGIVAVLEVSRLAGEPERTRAPVHDLVAAVRRDFASARWPVSPGQAGYFAKQLGLTPGPATLSDEGFASSRLAGQFAIARAVRRALVVDGALAPGDVRAVAAGSAQRPRQLYLAAIDTAGGVPLTLALDVDLEVARTRIWAEVVGDSRATSAPELTPASGATPFRGAFRFWSIGWPAAAEPVSWRSRDELLFGGATLGVLSVLVLGVVLLVRDVARDASTARLQADLVSGVSHELKTPLSVIQLYAESLVDEADGSDDPRGRHVRVILHESERLGHLVRRVLEFSRHETGQPGYQIERHDPVAFVRAFVSKYGAYLAHLGFTPTLDLEVGTPDVDVDAAALTQVVVNLVDNAVKYSGDSRVLILRVSPVGASVAIDVEDRGVGIPEGERAHLFEAFHRGSRTVGRGGYGIGLHLVARIVEAHGGHVDVESPAEGGTRVRLLLPAAPPVGE